MRRWFIALLLLAGCGSKPEGPPAPGLKISGTIRLDPAMTKEVRDSDAIFLIARPAEGGPPLAVLKLYGRSYPYAFELTDRNLMLGGATEGPLNLTVRVDKDGDPMTRGPGDLSGEYAKNPAAVDERNVEIMVDRKQ